MAKLNKSTSTSKAMKASGAGYSTTSKGKTTFYKSSKDSAGYSDEGTMKGTTPGKPMGTLDATQIAESNTKGGKVDALTAPTVPGAPTAIPETAPNNAVIQPPNAPSQSGNALKDLSIGMVNGSAGGTNAIANTIAAPKTENQKGFDALTASGIQPSSDWGQNRMTAKSYTQQTPAQNPVDTMMQQDEGLTAIVDLYKDYMSPENQKASLTETYQEMLKDTGIEDIDMDLIDMKNVIEGSEDDIRLEITKAGGFATDSQVQAMTNARNKSLIKNYNTLLETRNAKAQYLDTMIGLEAQDRQYASQQFDRMMNFGFQMTQMQQQMKVNAQNQYYKIAEATGWDGLYNSAQAHGTTALIEQTLGMPQGGLAQASLKSLQGQLMQQQEHDLDIKVKESSLLTDALQRDNIRSEIHKRNNPDPVEPKAPDLQNFGTSDNPDWRQYNPATGKYDELDGVGGGGTGANLSKVQRAKISDKVVANTELASQIQEYKDLIDDVGFEGTTWGATNLGKYDALRGRITTTLKKVETLGTLDAGVQQLVDKLIGQSPEKHGFTQNIGGFGAKRISSGLDTQLRIIKDQIKVDNERLNGINTSFSLPQEDQDELDDLFESANSTDSGFDPASYYD